MEVDSTKVKVRFTEVNVCSIEVEIGCFQLDIVFSRFTEVNSQTETNFRFFKRLL